MAGLFYLWFVTLNFCLCTRTLCSFVSFFYYSFFFTKNTTSTGDLPDWWFENTAFEYKQTAPKNKKNIYSLRAKNNTKI